MPPSPKQRLRIRKLPQPIFDWVTRVNNAAPFQACQIIGQYMAKKGYGRIINMASLAGQNGGTARVHTTRQPKGHCDVNQKFLPKSLRQKVLRSMRLRLGTDGSRP